MEGDYGGEPVNIDEIKNHPNVSPLEKIFFEPFYIYKWEEERDYSGDIKIKVLSKNKLEISLYKNGKFKRKILKGKITNNFFEVKTRRKVIGFPLLYFMLDIEKLMLGISNEGHLIVACRRYHFGSLFVLGGDSRHSIPLSYFPKKE